ncbi:glycosyltransferase family 39 protein, partial [Streptomyces toxytricini]|uniref:glycosyltransferase family 39 protein n=1 Tax=Streptomyces toxytricini TaxID=67369 RepID=UPI00341604DE
MTSAVPPLHAARADRAGASDGAAAPAVHRPRWELPALAALLAATAALLLWNLGASGYANSFYSAAAQAGSESWKAFFFGSSDAGNSITVDKPPAALWPMALSVRLFGLGGWQLLVPQALMGVATTAVLYAAVRRHFGPAAALLSGTVFALTPVAALMFRFNNPDALLTLLLTATVYCVLRALDGARTGWLAAAGAVVGLAFLTKTLQAFVILPPLALLYAVCAPTRLRRRLGQLLAAGAAMAAAGGWWVAVVELWPASSRPYIGGSQTNSFLELTLGYNGLGRINGNETGSVGGGRPGGGGGWGETGIDRLFSAAVGGQASWLLPAALAMLAAGLVITWRAGRQVASVESAARAAFLAWGGPLLLTAAVFSYMQGIFHEYYTVALAPFTAALVGMGTALLWEERGSTAAAAALSGTLALTAWWSWVLLGRSPDFLPWLRWAVLAAGLAAAAGLLAGARPGRRFTRGAAALGLVAALAGPFAYCLATVASPHTGSIPTAGPVVAGGGPGGRRVFEGAGLPPGAGPQGAPVQGRPGGMPGRDGRPANGRMLPGGQ